MAYNRGQHESAAAQGLNLLRAGTGGVRRLARRAAPAA
ncbi:hypothetical protein L810_2637 [Burkholderia sp. AU4i]|nr:hypothetical protein L810_2637 [Burkholderia sp. AU4i]QOH33315.1 hypothetical protein C7S14_6184 [Burkholderia cepacia]